MPNDPHRVSIVSGYFSPLHVGHLVLMEAARELTGHLIVVVNNDVQQAVKKGRVITPEDQRLRVVRALRIVDEAFVSVDLDASVTESLRDVRRRYPDAELHFCNGGDRRDIGLVPENEARGCAEAGITMHFGIGGTNKLDSSSRMLLGENWSPE